MKVITVNAWAWIPKVGLTLTQLHGLRAALTILPRKVGDYPGEAPGPIKLFVEDDLHIGVAREYFMARRRDDHVVEFDTTEGDKELWNGPFVFAGQLREEQAQAVAHVSGLFKAGDTTGGIIRAVPGWGKCLGLGTPVLLFDGSVVAVEDLRAGDLLMGPDSKPRCVLSTARGHGPLFEVTPKRGRKWVCNDAHILTLVNSTTDEIEDIALQDWLRLRGRRKHHLKQFAPPTGVDFPSPPSSLLLDPYFLGVWYGDGTKSLKNVAVTTQDEEIATLCSEVAEHFDLNLRREVSTHLAHPCPTYFLARRGGSGPNRLLDLLREVVGDGVRLPPEYLRASRQDRLKFLAGWIDTDGYHNNGCYEIVQKRLAWAEDIAFLARSLGLRALVTRKVVAGADYWRIKLTGDFSAVPCRLERKKPRARLQKKVATRTSFKVQPIGEGEYAGFTLNGDGRFLLGDFTVTHNTVCACALMAAMQVPTLVVVHKEFLVNQWKERIAAFLPGASVGMVQQDVCDFADRSVVVAMVHSLVDRSYPPEFYRWPGLVITDEVHRIGAETWSRVPPRFPARWRVGFSATPRRKDGADAVFLNHIGPVLFNAKEKRLVAKVRRVVTKFKLVKMGSFNPSLMKKSMLLKFLCASDARNQEITDQLILALQAGRKVIVLSERLQHLDVLSQMLLSSWPSNAGPPPSTGLYVGGQSEEALRESSAARVIFATSQFASEGLDIPALDTLFLTTPLSDIEQAVGRIQRPFPGKKDPVVVDFMDDQVELCKKLAEYRERFYAKMAA
jgi:superfamily II DNA or RNA helicase